jgi:SpoVK/Ycf46/Vps4 family AAA+-type ATPase
MLPWSVATDTFLSDLALLVRARHPLIFIDTEEKDRAESLLRLLADHLKLPFYSWTRSKGLRDGARLAPDRATLSPQAALQEVEQHRRRALYNFQGLGAELEDRTVATCLLDAARPYLQQEGALVITGPEVEIPAALRPLSTRVALPAPSAKEYEALVKRIYQDLRQRMHVEVHLTQGELERLVAKLSGLTLLEAEKALTKAMVEDGRLGPEDIQQVVAAKRQIVERDGLLEYYPAEEALEVAGLTRLKAWLAQRKAIVLEPERARAFGLEFPKGVLLVGVQGCGKSLCARIIAGEWGLPLLKLDPAGLYNRYIGETERNFRRAMQTAEKMAPIVLWIDEVEKAFASGAEVDGGVSRRVLGTFLSWLQERKRDVFVVATANDVSQLPPELIRKGRFDELFFVDLPDPQARQAIFAVHLRRRGRDASRFDTAALAQASEGFSGADIEQVVLSALYAAFAAGEALSDEGLLGEIRATVPIGRASAEAIERLRGWAQGRAVPAD